MIAWLFHRYDQASLSIFKALVWSSSHCKNANCLSQTLCAFSITVLRNVPEGLRKVQYQVHRANKQVATVYLFKIPQNLVRVICTSNRGKWCSSDLSSPDFMPTRTPILWTGQKVKPKAGCCYFSVSGPTALISDRNYSSIKQINKVHYPAH